MKGVIYEFRAWDGEVMLSFELLKDMPLHLLNGNGMYTIMMYANFKDSSGNKVFEGDILQDEDGITQVVEFGLQNLDAFELIGFNFYSHSDSKNVGERLKKSYTVIGNIFQNKNVLK